MIEPEQKIEQMSDFLLLTPEERERFATWLEQNAESSKGIIKQMEKVNISPLMVQKEKREMVACLIVARMLRGTETVTL